MSKVLKPKKKIQKGLLRSIGRVSGIQNTSILSLIFHDNHLNEYINVKINNNKSKQFLVNSPSSSSLTTLKNSTISKSASISSNLANQQQQQQSSSSSVATLTQLHSSSQLSKSFQASNLNLADFLYSAMVNCLLQILPQPHLTRR